MQQQIQHLRAQWQAIYDGEPWYGASICDVLKNISTQEAFWRPAPGANSIAELLFHIIAWRILTLKRLQGDFDYAIEINSAADWTRYPNADAAVWTQLQMALAENQSAFDRMLQEKTDDFLTAASGSATLTVRLRLEGIMQHDVYHLGQIAQLKSLFGKLKAK